jgi:large subunit ribosomal protein L30
MNTNSLTVKQVKSKIGRPTSHQACLRGLGIRRMHEQVKVEATPENLGMVKKIAYMLVIEGA